MIFRIKGFDLDVSITSDKTATLVIEQRNVFRSILNDILLEIEGIGDRNVILDVDDKPIPFDKNAMMILDYLRYDQIFKSFLTMIYKDIEASLKYDVDLWQALDNEIIEIIRILQNILDDFDFEITYDSNIKVSSILKLLNCRIDSDSYSKPLDKLFLLFDLVSKYRSSMLIICVNLSQFYTIEEMIEINKYARYKKVNLLILESVNYDIIISDKNYLIDSDLNEYSTI